MHLTSLPLRVGKKAYLRRYYKISGEADSHKLVTSAAGPYLIINITDTTAIIQFEHMTELVSLEEAFGPKEPLEVTQRDPN